MESDNISEVTREALREQRESRMIIPENQSALIREQHQAFLLKITLLKKLQASKPDREVVAVTD